MAGVVTHISSITGRSVPSPYLTITLINCFQQDYYGGLYLRPRPRPPPGIIQPLKGRGLWDQGWLITINKPLSPCIPAMTRQVTSTLAGRHFYGSEIFSHSQSE